MLRGNEFAIWEDALRETASLRQDSSQSTYELVYDGFS